MTTIRQFTVWLYVVIKNTQYSLNKRRKPVNVCDEDVAKVQVVAPLSKTRARFWGLAIIPTSLKYLVNFGTPRGRNVFNGKVPPRKGVGDHGEQKVNGCGYARHEHIYKWLTGWRGRGVGSKDSRLCKIYIFKENKT